MDPVTLAMLVSAGAGLAGSLKSSSDAQGYQGQQLQQAQMNYALQKQLLEHQKRMSEAGRTDAAGNRVYFNGKDWVTDPTDATKGIISASQLNEREQQAAGGTRREFGQQDNFENRGNVGNEADAILRLMRDRIGAPTYEGTRGRNAVAAATEVGSSRDTLVDAVSRNLIRSGGSGSTSDRMLDMVDNNAAGNLRGALAKNDAQAPEMFRTANEGWETGRMNKFSPLNAIRSNISDAPFAPTQVGAPIDAQLGQAATYGAATSGRGGAGLNVASGLVNNVPYSPMPWGNAIGALGGVVEAYMKKQGDKPIPWNEDSRNPGAFNSWKF